MSNKKRVEATAGAKAFCPLCQRPVIAKCGTQRVHHWAHLGRRTCDPLKENETEWHRKWKNFFPEDWQEYVQIANSGEKHIADVRTKHGFVLEFQHSPLKEQERIAREAFYQRMVWIVNGTRLKNDYPRFHKGFSQLRVLRFPFGLVFFAQFPEEHFPKFWVNSSVPVLFDFKGLIENTTTEKARESLWCVLPNRAQGQAVIMSINREQLLERAKSLPDIFETPPHEFVASIALLLKEMKR